MVLKDTTVLNDRVNRRMFTENKYVYSKYFNKAHFEKINKLINLAHEKGIELFFIIPPRLKRYEELFALKSALGDNKVIDLSSVQEYPALYKPENSFDIGHLNRKGAVLFSEYMAIKFQKIIKDK